MTERNIFDLHFFPNHLISTFEDGVVIHGFQNNLRSYVLKLNLKELHASNDGGYQALLDQHNCLLLIRSTTVLFKLTLQKPVVSLALDNTGQHLLVGHPGGLLSLYKQGHFVSFYDVECADFCGFLPLQNTFLVYAVSRVNHQIIVLNLETGYKVTGTGPGAQIVQVLPHPKDQALFLLTDTGAIYKWRYERPFLESALVPHFTQLVEGQDNVTAEDCPEDKFDWRNFSNKKKRTFAIDSSPDDLFIRNEAWFLVYNK